MIDGERFEVTARSDVDGGTKLTGRFRYRDIRGAQCLGRGHFYVPHDRHAPAPLMYAAGYELMEDRPDQRQQIGEYLKRGWVVVNPGTPLPGEAWPGENPLCRLVNLDVALLHIARAQSFIDNARVMLSGGSAGGWMSYMLAAESFPLAGCASDVGPVNLAYNIGYFLQNADASAGELADGRTPAVPGIALVGAVLAGQLVEALGSDFVGWDELSPVGQIEAITCPLHAFYSTGDVLVPFDQVTRDSSVQNTTEFPRGFRFTAADLGVSDVRLTDVLTDVEIVRLAVPTDAPDHDIEWLLDQELASELDDMARMALPVGNERCTVCVVDEGAPGPRCDHFKHRLDPDRSAFWDLVTAQTLSVDQLTAEKLRVLLMRHAGREWIDSSLRHLDEPDAERNDVERGLDTYRSISPAHEARFRELYAAVPPDLQVLTRS